MEALKRKEKQRDNLVAALIAMVIALLIGYLTWNSWVDVSSPEAFARSVAFVILFGALFFVFAFMALSYRFRLWRDMKPRQNRR